MGSSGNSSGPARSPRSRVRSQEEGSEREPVVNGVCSGGPTATACAWKFTLYLFVSLDFLPIPIPNNFIEEKITINRLGYTSNGTEKTRYITQ